MPDFEWDESKNASNFEKHGISFDEVTDIFDDPNRLQEIQRRGGERRWKTIGAVLSVVLTVVYTTRENLIRLISARAASRKERSDYINNENKSSKNL